MSLYSRRPRTPCPPEGWCRATGEDLVLWVGAGPGPVDVWWWCEGLVFHRVSVYDGCGRSGTHRGPTTRGSYLWESPGVGSFPTRPDARSCPQVHRSGPSLGRYRDGRRTW